MSTLPEDEEEVKWLENIKDLEVNQYNYLTQKRLYRMISRLRFFIERNRDIISEFDSSSVINYGSDHLEITYRKNDSTL
jgi:hypothetical protein